MFPRKRWAELSTGGFTSLGAVSPPCFSANTRKISIYLFFNKHSLLFFFFICFAVTSLVTQMSPSLQNLPAMQETRVQSLGQEDPLEKGMATHSSILPWRIPWTEEPGRLQSRESQRVRHEFHLLWWILVAACRI